MRRSHLGRLPDCSGYRPSLFKLSRTGTIRANASDPRTQKAAWGHYTFPAKPGPRSREVFHPPPCSSLSLPHTIATWVKKKRYPSGMREHRVFVSHRIDLECSRLSTPLLVLCSLVIQRPIAKCKPQFMPPQLVTARMQTVYCKHGSRRAGS